MFVDKSLLTFDLVSQLSQLIRCDDNASDDIIKRLMNCCPSLRGSCCIQSTLEQSTIILLSDLATRRSSVRGMIYPSLSKMLSSIEGNLSYWCDKFETDFGKTLLLQILKCETQNSIERGSKTVNDNAVCDEIVKQITYIIEHHRSIPDYWNRSSTPEAPVLKVMFDVIGDTPEYRWEKNLKGIIKSGQTLIS